MPTLRPRAFILFTRLPMPPAKRVRSPCNSPFSSLKELCQQSSRFILSYPAARSPFSFTATAVSYIRSSSILFLKVFQLDQPMGGAVKVPLSYFSDGYTLPTLEGRVNTVFKKHIGHIELRFILSSVKTHFRFVYYNTRKAPFSTELTRWSVFLTLNVKYVVFHTRARISHWKNLCVDLIA